MNDIILASNKSKGKRPYFFDDAAVERVLNITMAVAQELAVTRERLDTLERLLEKKGIIYPVDIESFTPNEAQAEARQRAHATYIARILRIVQQEVEAIRQDAASNRSMEDIAEELGQS
jgi:hypothetical protein